MSIFSIIDVSHHVLRYKRDGRSGRLYVFRVFHTFETNSFMVEKQL
jgi:hypothetical protein